MGSAVVALCRRAEGAFDVAVTGGLSSPQHSPCPASAWRDGGRGRAQPLGKLGIGTGLQLGTGTSITMWNTFISLGPRAIDSSAVGEFVEGLAKIFWTGISTLDVAQLAALACHRRDSAERGQTVCIFPAVFLRTERAQ